MMEKGCEPEGSWRPPAGQSVGRPAAARGVARAAIHEPRVLLIDEAISALEEQLG